MLEGDPTNVGVDERICPPAVKLHLSGEELSAAIVAPIFFRTILSHLENYSSPPKLPIRATPTNLSFLGIKS